MPRQPTTEQEQADTSTLSQFYEEINRRFDLLKNQQDRLQLFYSRRELLNKRYDLNPSLFTQLAHWHEQQSWYQKWLLHGEATAVALALGILFGGFALLATAGAYCAILYYFDDHNKTEKIDRETLSGDIITLEKELQEDIESFNQLQTKYSDLLQAMQKQNSTLARCIALLSQGSVFLQEKIKQLKQDHNDAKELEAEIQSFDKQLYQQQILFQQMLDKISKYLLEQQEADKAESLLITTVKQRSEEFGQAVSRITDEVNQQEEVIETQSTRCNNLGQRIAQVTADIHNDLASLSAEIESSQTSRQEAEHILQEADDAIERGRQALQNSLHQRQPVLEGATGAPDYF